MASLPSHAAEQTGRLSQPKGPSFKWLSAILLALLMLVSANLLKRVHRLPTRHTVARAMEANLHKVVDKSMLETIIASNPGAAMSGGRGTWPTAGTLVPLNEILPNGEDLVGDARWHRADDDVGDDIDSLPPNELAKKMTGRRGQPKGQPKGPGGGPDKPAPEQPQGKQWGVKDSAAAAKRVVGSQAGSAVGFAKPPPPPRGTAVGKAITAPVKELLHQHGAANTDTTYTLVIVIGCAPSNFARRGALRATWLQWAIEAPDVLHLFFTENIVEGGRGYTEEAAAQIQQEHDEIGDIIFQEGASGYGKENGRRELFHVQYMLERYKFKYYLRVDDDGFLCLRQLLDDIRGQFPPSILHGKYHCHDKKARMDENYLLMSRDLCAVIGEGFGTGQLPFGPKLTFALNLGNLVPMLMGSGVHIFDDGSRICWPYGGTDTPCHRAWRGELKTRTHEPGPFCDHFVWSHWVKKVESFHMIYDMQTNRTDTDTMRPRATGAAAREPTDRDRHVGQLLATPVCNRHHGFNLGPDKNGVPYYVNPAAVVGPNWGIPGMRPLANDSVLLAEITANVTALFAKHRKDG